MKRERVDRHEGQSLHPDLGFHQNGKWSEPYPIEVLYGGAADRPLLYLHADNRAMVLFRKYNGTVWELWSVLYNGKDWEPEKRLAGHPTRNIYQVEVAGLDDDRVIAVWATTGESFDAEAFYSIFQP